MVSKWRVKLLNKACYGGYGGLNSKKVLEK